MSRLKASVKFIIGAVFATALVLLFFDESVVKLVPTDYDSILRTESIPFSNSDPPYVNYTNILFDHCEVQELDPWDPMIVKYLDPNNVPWKECVPTIKIMSKLINGQLFINNNTVDSVCHYRCLHPKDDHTIAPSRWEPIINGSRPRCDIVELNCTQTKLYGIFGNTLYYHYLHAQIFRPDEVQDVNNTLQKPDVHIILFDSVSHSQFIRSMSKTRQVLREHYESISFRHLNKIGLNSQPNGFALLTGKAINPISKSPMSVGHPTDYPDNSYCNKYMDDQQFIGFRFQDDGYVTMMNEDWDKGVFNYPDCKGFQKTPTDHYMRPFQLRVDGGKWKSEYLNKAVHKQSCHETFYHQMEYLKDFIDKYPDKPKFSLTWMIYLAHNDGNSLYHTDDYFYQFFKDYKEKLSNSYLFVMGDHGLRFGGLRNTPVGEVEDNNPFLFFSVPENVREDGKLMAQIRKNSKELITHYDLYATLSDIVNPKNPRIPNPLIRGSSILKELSQPRTCDRLWIPFEYCSCQMRKTRLPKNSPVGIEAAEVMIKEMNRILEEEPDTKDKCAKLTLSEKGVKTEIFEDKSIIKMYRVEYITKPGNGQFWGYMTQNPADGDQLRILSERFPRMNKYAEEARCAGTAKYAAYCYCKDLLKK